MKNPNFMFGNVRVYGNLILAPMDGISDQPFRLLCRNMGSSITFTEFINVLDVPMKLSYIDKRTCFSVSEKPVGFQLYGRDSKRILKAAQILSEKEPDFFDVNLGCSVKKVAGRGAGAGLLKEPKLVENIFTKLVKNLEVPVTAKIRLGWDQEHINHKEISKVIEGSGAAMITVHARTRDQGWGELANWNAIREVKEVVKIPVIGNGDVHSKKDIDNIINQTSCDGVMIGRSAIGNPWIFSNISKASLSKKQIIDQVKVHWLLMIAFYGPKKTSTFFKKHLKAYLSCPQFAHIDLREIISMPNPMKNRLFYE
ncbi:MAG: tRNA-dihydrouridine synthase family protein [Anaerolineaceae bacterium]|nr:tRNA-dihydrouridine synthase family protein [Anaerolineaceae bacterium]